MLTSSFHHLELPVGGTKVSYDLKRSSRAFEYGLSSCAAMHNHRAAAFDGKKSPQESVLQRLLNECGSSLIGTAVLAELPDLMKTTALSRFVEAAYVLVV